MLLYSTIRAPLLAMAVEASHGLTFSLFLVASIDHVNRVVPGEWRASGQTLLWAACYGIGGIVGNAWAGALYDRLGVQALFRVNSWLVLGVALLAAFLLHEGGRERASAVGEPAGAGDGQQ
jgi:PPP family 3-phenylpropionic acid transporter